MAQNQIWQTLTKISLGLVLVLVWAFLWVRADVFFPINTQIWKVDYILTFILLLSFVFAWDTVSGSKTERALFRVSFLKRFPVFLIAAGISSAILFGFGLLITGNSIATISQAISSVALGVIILHAFMISIGEELVFRGWVPERLLSRGISANTTMIISTVVFALFHAGMGKSFLTLLTYIPLGIIFYQVKRRYSPETNMANAGVHFAWNLFILGFLM